MKKILYITGFAFILVSVFTANAGSVHADYSSSQGSIYCSATPTTGRVGDQITWRAVVSGIPGQITYSWDGTDGLSGSSDTVYRSYSSVGTKQATIHFQSGYTSGWATCYTYVGDGQNNDYNSYGTLSVSCYSHPSTARVGDQVMFYTQVTGGNGNYTYSWSGSENLSGYNSQITKQYYSEGSKSATVMVRSGSLYGQATCNAYISQSYNNSNDLSGYCDSNQTYSTTGQQIVWRAHAQNGSGNYSYVWSGTDGLSGNADTAVLSYYSSGTKTATVRISSGSQSITRTCSTTVSGGSYNQGPLVASCYASTVRPRVGETVFYQAAVSGGNGSYSYTWSGTDGLYGYNQNISKSYNAIGTKSAHVKIVSDGQTLDRDCSILVVDGYGDNYNDYNNNYGNNLEATCDATPTNASVNGLVTYTARPTGGNGYYVYSWSGADGLSGANSRLISTTYSTGGQKYAYVSISSNGQTITRTCNAYIQAATTTYITPTKVTGGHIYLTQIPYTGLADHSPLTYILTFAGFWALVLGAYFGYRKMKTV